MKTTILTSPPVQKEYPVSGSGPVLLVHLILVTNYFIVLFLLLLVPQRHGYGGGSSVSLPSFLVLFSVLVILHIGLILRHRLPPHIIQYIDIILAIISAMTLSLILFSRQSANLLQAVYPIPLLISVSLGISLVLGVIFGKVDVFTGKQRSSIPTPGKISLFPLPENRYRNVRHLTDGGVGTIWYAERITDGIPVVVKVPTRDDEQTGMSFLQEMSIWKELNHPNIVSVLSVNVLPVPYMEMEYLPGSLASLKKPVSITRALNLIGSMISALIYAHGQGIVHCDIKPTNILMTREGVPKLTDWGLSRSGSSRWAVSGFSPRYAAPEQTPGRSECNQATDIWQIGMILAELLTGKADIPSGDESVFYENNGAGILPSFSSVLPLILLTGIHLPRHLSQIWIVFTRYDLRSSADVKILRYLPKYRQILHDNLPVQGVPDLFSPPLYSGVKRMFLYSLNRG